MLYSWSDQKKKSNLMLSVFEPGGTPFPWLGDISYLGPALGIPGRQESLEDSASPFPVLPELKQSYQTQSNAVWIKSSGLQVSDHLVSCLGQESSCLNDIIDQLIRQTLLPKMGVKNVNRIIWLFKVKKEILAYLYKTLLDTSQFRGNIGPS